MKKIPITKMDWDWVAIKALMTRLDKANVVYKWLNCSNKDVITTLDNNKNPVHQYKYIKPYESEEQAQTFRHANKVVKTLESFWNNGLHENKKLMDTLINNRLFAERTYDFNLPKLELNDYFVQTNVKSLDFNNAYAKVLFNHRLINRDMYEMMVRLPKPVRLVTLGMLAKSYVEHTCNDYDLINDDEVKLWRYSNYANLYFFAVQKTTEVMQTISNILGDDLLFWWVDGCYMKSSTTKKKIDEIVATITTRLPSQRFDYKWEDVPYLRYEKEASGEQFLFLQKRNSKTGKLEDKEYTFSSSWEKN